MDNKLYPELKALENIFECCYFNKLPQQIIEDTRSSAQFYRCDYDFASKNSGSELMECIIEHMAQTIEGSEFEYVSIDSKVTMLIPGIYPAIPGWHCDDFYRPDESGQPDLINVRQQAPQEHYMVCVGECQPEFLGTHASGIIPINKTPNTYKEYDRFINANIHRYDLLGCKSGQIYKFGPHDFHRTTKATKKEWRLFVRITLSNHREPLNEIRTQTQVYMDDPSIGW